MTTALRLLIVEDSGKIFGMFQRPEASTVGDLLFAPINGRRVLTDNFGNPILDGNC
jgi:hypothetical protein